MTTKEPEGGSAMMYRQAILDHYKDPTNWGRLDPADVDHEGENPLCGDRLTVTLAVDGDDNVADARFEGQGCAISQASTDIFLDDIKGRPLDDVLAMDESTIRELLGIELSPARVKCAMLGLIIVRDGIRISRGELELAGPSKTE